MRKLMNNRWPKALMALSALVLLISTVAPEARADWRDNNRIDASVRARHDNGRHNGWYKNNNNNRRPSYANRFNRYDRWDNNRRDNWNRWNNARQNRWVEARNWRDNNWRNNNSWRNRNNDWRRW